MTVSVSLLPGLKRQYSVILGASATLHLTQGQARELYEGLARALKVPTEKLVELEENSTRIFGA